MINLKRHAIAEVLSDVKTDRPIVLPFSKEEVIKLLFDKKIDKNGKKYYEINKTMDNVKNKIDFSDVPFDDVKVSSKDFTGTKGVKINPQTIYQKDLSGTILNGVEIIGQNSINKVDIFEGVSLAHTNFKGSSGAHMNPQTIKNKALTGSNLSGIDFTGCSFDGVNIRGANFAGSIGVKINPFLVSEIDDVYLQDVELTDLPTFPSWITIHLEGSNYNELLKEKQKQKQDFYELIKGELPVNQEEEKEIEQPPTKSYKPYRLGYQLPGIGKRRS